MASYRPFPPPPQSTFGPPPTQNPVPPQPGGNQYPQNWGYNGGDGSYNAQNYSQMHPGSGYQQGGYGTSTSRNQHPLPPPNHQQQQPQYPYPLPPPPPESSYPPPPPPSITQNGLNLPPAPGQMYYPSSQFSQFNHQPLQPVQPPPPPPPPSSPPPSSSIPPPPPPSQPPSPPPPPSVPTADQTKGSRADGVNRASNNVAGSSWHDAGPSNKGLPSKHHKHHGAPLPPKKSNAPPTKIETEEERKIRKKREFEKQRQDEKRRQQLKESQNALLQKTQILPSGVKGHGSIGGSRMGERRATPLISGERTENRLKKPTTFLCRLKFRNELPDPTAQPKLLSLRRNKDRFSEYAITSLEKMHKPQLHVEADLGIPLDLLDLSVYNPPRGRRSTLDPADDLILQDDNPVTPQKKDGIRTKSRPEDVGFSWLVKTQYISPLSMEGTKQSLSEKQAKEMREARGGGSLLENLNNRERRIHNIEASFEACKSRPVHSTKKELYPVEVLPLLPDLDRYDDHQFVVATFDGAPTADSEIYGKLDKPVRDAIESRAVMKSYVATGSDSGENDKFLAYMAPLPDELGKDIYDEDEDVSYSWVREYNWDVRGDADDPTTYLVAFGESDARYVPLPTKLILRKKRSKEGKTGDEVAHFPAPSRVTVRRRDTAAVIGLRERENDPPPPRKRARLDMDDHHHIGRHQKDVGDEDMYASSGGEAEYTSD